MARRTVEVRNIISPDHVTHVDADKYEAMRVAYLDVVPTGSPGATPAEIKANLLPLLDQTLFPAGEKAGWWAKCVQLDLEARGLILRMPGSPVRLHKA